MTFENAKDILEINGQQHILQYYDELDDAGKSALLDQIERIDFSIFNALDKQNNFVSKRGVIEPLGAVTIDEIKANESEYEVIGIEALKECKVGAILLAGGQGTRLGFNKPKGSYNIGETKDIYIFQCLIENMMKVVEKSGAFIPLAIMTSDINNADTIAFFEEHDYFGYDKSFVYFFVQDMAPATDYEGKIFLSDKGHIAMSPNGNGGWFTSFVNAGLLDRFSEYGVEWMNVFAVDNVLQKIADPYFVGATIKSGAVCGAKVVAKAFPEERVGLLCTEDGRPSIVEYYEMTDEMMYSKDENGRLLYNYGVILNYLFSVEELKRIMKDQLQYHTVEKKVPHIDKDGNFIEPDEPNGLKYELLVLDLIHLMKDCLSYEVVREKEFAPIKRLTGVDSVDTAKELLKLNGIKL